MKIKKKLIEVALPLEAINTASAREKSIRHGHPSTLHLWWSRKPLAACRAVLFASMVDDPSSRREEFPTEEAQDMERLRLFAIIERLVLWENSNNKEVLNEARAEILKHTNGKPPPILDPFAGGGSIPLEAQRLGLDAHASDLNPVAVLISKALIEIPPKFVGQPPINPVTRDNLAQGGTWHGAAGLAEDIRYYGRWMREEAEKRIGHLYPKATAWIHRSTGTIYSEEEYANILAHSNTSLSTTPAFLCNAGDLEKHELTVIAWLWARTVKCPNPACGLQMPLATEFAISKKKGRESWVEPSLDKASGQIRFAVKHGVPSDEERATIESGTCVIVDRDKNGMPLKKIKKVKATFRCVACKSGIAKGEYIDAEANAGRIGALPLAIVAENNRGRVYLPFSHTHLRIAVEEVNRYIITHDLSGTFPTQPAKGTFASNAQGRIYGFRTFADYFMPRQLVALTTFSSLVGEARAKVLIDAEAGGCDKKKSEAYADAIATYLALCVDKSANLWSSVVSWMSDRGAFRETFARQAISMAWDYAEASPFSESGGSILLFLERVSDAVAVSPCGSGVVEISSAEESSSNKSNFVFSTDPPYYDNVGYADLSDFFYVWLRRSLRGIYPELFSTMLVPKSEELVATPYRFNGSKDKAREFFESGLHHVFCNIVKATHSDYPVTIYYAFKQSEADIEEDEESGTSSTVIASTGWETFLQSLMDAGMQVTATWPMRTESSGRIVAKGTNALASSIVLACRRRPDDASTASRREFVNALRRELADALRAMMSANVAPVDLAQATIGPGMAVYSRYAKVLEPDGTPLRVRTALQIINAELDTVLAEQEGEYDADTRFCLAWFEQFSMNAAAFGEADVLARGKNTSVAGLAESGVLEAKAGKVRLLKREELPDDWKPATDTRRSIWETCQHLIKLLYDNGSEEKAARLLAELGGDAEAARDLAYRLYSICERKGWAQEAIAYNSLVTA